MDYFSNFQYLSENGRSFVSACNLLDQTNRALANQEINRFVNEYLTPNELLTDSDKFYIHLYILNYNQCKSQVIKKKYAI